MPGLQQEQHRTAYSLILCQDRLVPSLTDIWGQPVCLVENIVDNVGVEGESTAGQ